MTNDIAMPTDARFSRSSKVASGTVAPPPQKRQHTSTELRKSTAFSRANPSVAEEVKEVINTPGPLEVVVTPLNHWEGLGRCCHLRSINASSLSTGSDALGGVMTSAPLEVVEMLTPLGEAKALVPLEGC